jgi:hypothetical protein
MTDSSSTWRQIPGFEDYEASDHGHIAWNSPPGRKMLRPGTNTSGHQTVGLYKDGRRHKKYIHELVLLAHVGERPTGYVACHADDIPHHNDLTNLRWDTRRANFIDALRNGRYDHLLNES